jgi:hypothetical protein
MYGCNSSYGATNTGNNNIAIGYQAMLYNIVGSNNIAFGCTALGGSNSGSNNIGMGFGALKGNSTGSNNYAIGCIAGCSITTGCGNVIIGGFAGTAGLTETFVVQAGTCQRLKVDSGGLCVNGATGLGSVTLTTATEILNTKTTATGVVTHDYSTGSIWYHTSISANFTPNFTNVPTTDARTLVTTLILVQGATAYIPSALQVAGTGLTIKWVNGVTPTGNPNKVDIATFTLIRSGAAWAQALGSYASFG